MDLSCSSIYKIVLRSFDPGFHMSGDHKVCLLSFPNRGFTEALSPGPLKCHRRCHLTIPWEALGAASEKLPLWRIVPGWVLLQCTMVTPEWRWMEPCGCYHRKWMNPFKKKKISFLNGFNLACPKKKSATVGRPDLKDVSWIKTDSDRNHIFKMYRYWQ